LHFDLAAVPPYIPLYKFKVDDMGVVRPEEQIGGQQVFKFLKSLADGQFWPVDKTKYRIVALRLDVNDVVDIEKEQSIYRRDGYLVEGVF
jgi:hypothetical protein